MVLHVEQAEQHPRNWTFAIRRDVAQIPMMREDWKPDPEWEHTDTEGHSHRWWRMGGNPTRTNESGIAVVDERREWFLPTLKHVEPSECDEYDPRHYECWVCGEEIEPKFRRSSAGGRVRAISAGVHYEVNGEEVTPDEFEAARTQARIDRLDAALEQLLTVVTGIYPHIPDAIPKKLELGQWWVKGCGQLTTTELLDRLLGERGAGLLR